ncbi:MAG: sigma 54-interacting transcriptional regulator, partial [Myxococcota bacterium]
MTSPLESLERYDRLHGVQVARAILRAALGLELTILSEGGSLHHQRGGIMPSSSEICRSILFSRRGFPVCEAFYRDLGAAAAEGPATQCCPFRLGAMAVPVTVDNAPVAVIAASGFSATELSSAPPVDPAWLAEELRSLDPNLADPGAIVRQLPLVRGDRTKIVWAILDVAAREIARFETDLRAASSRTEDAPGLWGIVGNSPQMRSVFSTLRRVAESDATVLIVGESGTGKDLVARALYEHGRRSERPFIHQSCGSMSDDLLESTLFGHVRGAFSGAFQSSSGLFGAAEGGTVFLDQVGEMSPALQVKLLRVLQDGSYLPVGATSPRHADVRVIAASNHDLKELVARGTFREDLFYRLHVLPIRLPPLRDRAGDLPLLVDAFQRDIDMGPRRISDAAWSCLERYRFPGNVRELRAEVQRWALHAKEVAELGPEHLSVSIREAGGYGGMQGGDAAVRAA